MSRSVAALDGARRVRGGEGGGEGGGEEELIVAATGFLLFAMPGS